MRVLLYCRCSTEEQSISGAGIQAQRQALQAECERRGWTIVREIADEGYSAKDMRRPGVKEAILALESGEADALVVSRLDRLSRSMADFSALMARAQKRGWALVALDCVDTTSPSGEMMAHVLATFAAYERRLISQRTKDALAIKRAQGVRLGRPPVLADAIRRRISAERRRGDSFAAIAERLNAEAVPTAHGGARWHPATVRAIAIASN
jgi:DNA invertase Pin-like site-specific DNA recombinase